MVHITLVPVSQMKAIDHFTLTGRASDMTGFPKLRMTLHFIERRNCIFSF